MSRIVKFLNSSPRRGWLFGLFLVAATMIAYIPALDGSFVWDDDSWTTKIIGLLRDTAGLCLIWFHPTALQQYYPLSATSFWLDYHLWKFWTTPYHVENVLLHSLAALLFWRLLLRLLVPGAWLASALFALNPVMVESVAWITERKSVLSLVLYLGALLAYGRYAQWWVTRTGEIAPVPDSSRGTRRPSLFYGLAYVLFLCALLAKTTAFSLPAAILLVAWWKRGQIRWREDGLPTLPFFALALGLGALTAWLEKNHVGAQGPDFALTFPQRCLVAGRVFWFYLGKLLWPANLCFIYPRWQTDPNSWWQWLYPAAAIGTLFTLWRARGRIGRGPVTALFFYVGTLFPLIGFMNAYAMLFSFVCDHWVYLSALGIIALVAVLVVRMAEFLRTPAVVHGFAAIVLPVLTLLAWRQAGTYADEETLWRDTLAKNPAAWMAHNNLGMVLEEEGKRDEAIQHFERAVQLKPDFAEPHNNLGLALAAQGNWAEAIQHYERALQLKPDFAGAHNNLGVALARQGKLDEAIQHYERAVQLKPDFAELHNNLGLALAAQGNWAEAIQHYERAVQLKPDFAEAHNSLGVALARQGKLDEAINHFESALAIRPGFPLAEINLDNAVLRQGHVEQAIENYQAAIQLEPNNVAYLNNLAWLLATTPEARFRNGQEAVQLAERACQLTDYKQPQLIGTLAAAYAEAGRFEDAVASAQEAHDLALVLGQQTVASKNQELLQLYKARQPYRE